MDESTTDALPLLARLAAALAARHQGARGPAVAAGGAVAPARGPAVPAVGPDPAILPAVPDPGVPTERPGPHMPTERPDPGVPAERPGPHMPAVSPGPEVPTGQDRALLLRLARDIAHAGERQDAPLSTYLLGRYVQMRQAEGVPAPLALREAAAAVREVAGESPEG